MKRSLEPSGARLRLLLYVSQAAALAAAVVVVVAGAAGPVGLLLAALFAATAVATAVALRRGQGDDGPAVLGTAEDITYDPVADPGQAAKRRWDRAVRRLPGRDDERD
ncbi:hypothetical protein [Halobaculum litoreum]|uniref:Uncharacterized protein n=1 Tax=Halobaculum litoreum TaxID=3031998 RepID=A0ABD5XWH2_9EURY|nr:hypothetical protein [Halobaculum sp. DT92]